MKRDLGFTLLELLVVMVIIGLLSAYVGPRYFSQIGKSERRVAKAQIEAFSKAIDAYHLDVGAFPSTADGLAALTARPANVPTDKWAGPYLSKAVPLDPWGHPYLYSQPGTQGADYDIVSYARDGVVGGTGDDADIDNH
jgi:general secretion pathway protein G